MTKVGTGYVEIKPDFSGFDRELRAKMAASFSGVGETIRQKVKVDVDRSQLQQLGAAISASLGDASRGVEGLLGNLPGIGALAGSLGSTGLAAAATSTAMVGLVGVVAALAASLGAAIAGAASLGVALAGALGPAILVTVAALARFVAIVKAVNDHEKNAGTEARGLAGAHAQLTAATDAVAQAQGNLRDQTTAAYAAWSTAIENVKDDLLGVKDAQLGIDDANLSLREAQQALKDFQKTAAGPALNAVFKKFTDVNVNESGLKSALAAATRGHGLSEDDELKLERLILNVRRAKLGEAHATDTLHDANTKLAADRKTEVDFATRGIAAYKPYTAATRQLAQAQRSLASAQRQTAAAAEKQTKAWDDLTPAERRFGQVLIGIGDTLKHVFTPVMAALLGGVTRGLRSFAAAATDPKIKGALVLTGKALGNAFATVAKVLTGPEMRRAFVTFAEAGAKIIGSLATAVSNLSLVLTRIGLAALGKNGLTGIIDAFTRWTGQLELTTRNSKDLHEKVQQLVDTFKVWANFLLATSSLLFKIGTFLAPLGTKMVEFLTHPIDSLKQLGLAIAGTKRDAAPLGEVLQRVGRVVGEAVGGMVLIFRGFLLKFRGIFKIIAAVLTLNFPEALSGAKDLIRGTIDDIKGILRLAVSPFHLLGQRLGGAIVHGVKAAFDGVLKFVEHRISDLISAYNALPLAPNIHDPFEKKQPGGTGKGGAGLTRPGTGLGSLPTAHGASLHVTHRTAPRFAPVATAAGSRQPVVEHMDVHITTPTGALPDGRILGEQLMREMARRR